LPAGVVATALRLARAGGAGPGPILALTDGGLRALFLSQLKTGPTAPAPVAAPGLRGPALHTPAADRPAHTPPPAPPPPAPPPAPHLTLRDWGSAVDPDGDCTFTIKPNALTIAVPGSDHVLGVERGRMNAPRVLREITGDFIAQVRVAGDFPAGARTLVPQ